MKQYSIYVSKVDKDTLDPIETKRVNQNVYARKGDTRKVIIEYVVDFIMSNRDKVDSYIEKDDHTSITYRIIMKEADYDYLVYSL